MKKELPALPAEYEDTQLEDMKHVYHFPKGYDKTEGQRTCRRFKEESLVQFMAHKAALERLVPDPPKPVTEEEYLKEESVARILENCEELLEKLK